MRMRMGIIGIALAFIPIASTVAQESPPAVVIEPSSLALKKGDSLTVAVSARTAEQSVNAVEFFVEYTPETLRFESFDSADTEFEIEAPGASGNLGVVTMARASIEPKNDNEALITVLTFTAIADGLAKVGIDEGTKLLSASSSQDILGSTFVFTAVIGDTPVVVVPGEPPVSIGSVSETALDGRTLGPAAGPGVPLPEQGNATANPEDPQSSEATAATQQPGDDSALKAPGISAQDELGSGNQWVVAVITGIGVLLIGGGYWYVRRSSEKSGLKPEPMLRHGNGNGAVSAVRPDTLPRSVNPEYDEMNDLLSQVHGAEVTGAEVINKTIKVE